MKKTSQGGNKKMTEQTEQMEEKQLAEALGGQRLRLRALVKCAGVSRAEMAAILDYLRTLNTARVSSARMAVGRLVAALEYNVGVVDDETAQALRTLNQKLQEVRYGGQD
jgi:hypothetical protein